MGASRDCERARAWGASLSLAVLVLALGLIASNLVRPYSGNLALYRQGMSVEASNINSPYHRYAVVR